MMTISLREKKKILNTEKKALRKDYKKIYTKMFIYISSFSLNYYTRTDLLLEIVGICLENQERNIPLDDVFNNDYKAFCDTMIADSLRMSKRQKALELILQFMAIIFLCSILFVLLSFTPLYNSLGSFGNNNPLHGWYYTITLKDLSYYLINPFIISLAILYSNRHTFKGEFNVFIIYFILYVVLFSISMFFLANLPLASISLPIYLIILITGMITAGLYCLFYGIQKKEYLLTQ